MVPSLIRLGFGPIYMWSSKAQQYLPLISKQLYFCHFIEENRVGQFFFASTPVWSSSIVSDSVLLTVASTSSLVSVPDTSVGAYCVFSSFLLKQNKHSSLCVSVYDNTPEYYLIYLISRILICLCFCCVKSCFIKYGLSREILLTT